MTEETVPTVDIKEEQMKPSAFKEAQVEAAPEFEDSPGDDEDRQEEAAKEIVEALEKVLPATRDEPFRVLVSEFQRRLPQLRSLYKFYSPSPADIALDSRLALRDAFGDKLIPLGVLLFQKEGHWRRFTESYRSLLERQVVADYGLGSSLVSREKFRRPRTPLTELAEHFRAVDPEQLGKDIVLLNGAEVPPGRREHIRLRAVNDVQGKIDAEAETRRRIAELERELAGLEDSEVAKRGTSNVAFPTAGKLPVALSRSMASDALN